ncbi:MAG: GH36-type glycosyl hydrolase domain-containing protein [Armatimonadota bacterium]
MGLDKYGHFSEDGREFIITKPDTPAPWVNYISNARYTGLVTNAGGGYSFYICPKDSRITRLRYNGLPWDRPGRYVYLRDADDGEYWSLSWQPVAKNPDFYECRHGMGYTQIESEYKGIRSKLLYFVPQDDDMEIWKVSLENKSDVTRTLSVFSYVELCLGHALVDLINQPNDQHFNVVKFDRENDFIYATKNYWVTYSGATVKQPNQAWNKYVFFATSLPVEGFDGKKDAFIGQWRSESNPVAIEEGHCRDTEITASDACAALQSSVTLEPGECKEFVILMGIVDREGYQELAPPIVNKYRDMANVDRAFDDLKSYWDCYLSVAQIETPDPNLDLIVNTWGKRQAWVTFHMHRTAGYYHGGLLFGTGIRDQCQDLMGPLMAEPDMVADRICDVISHQFADGSTLHNYFRLTGYGEKTGHSDTPLWLPLAVVSYLKETGDFDFLNRVVPFYDEGEGTVLDHVIRAIEYPLSNLTSRHLPKFGPGDWNDTLDYVGRKGIGESVWVAEFLCFILRETAGMLDKIGNVDKAQEFRAEYDKVAQALNELCWDGEWYFRGTRDDGGVIGSHTNEEGRIFMNAESWAVISGIAPDDRAHLSMDSAYKMLNTPRGPKILTPAYTKVDPGVGLATRCVPGKKENAAVFNHVAAWAVLAECLLGNGNRAYEYYQKTMPMNQAYDPDIYRMEPYVYSEYVTSPDHPTFGEASHSWLTGSGVWMLRDGLDYILGIRPTFDGLLVDPCIPAEWNGFKVTRKFRGAVYEIEVLNPDHVQHGVVSLEVNGIPVSGNVLPLSGEAITKVVCKMGNK